MKKLPNIYKNLNNQIKSHNDKVCYIQEEKQKEQSIEEVLDDIFSGYHIPYHIKVRIITKDKVIDTFLTARGKEYILTIQNELIKQKDILEIKRISN